MNITRKCQICPNDHGVEAVRLVNESAMDLCAGCRQTHASMLASTSEDVVLTAEEARWLAWWLAYRMVRTPIDNEGDLLIRSRIWYKLRPFFAPPVELREKR